jgi:hypothetical protein
MDDQRVLALHQHAALQFVAHARHHNGHAPAFSDPKPLRQHAARRPAKPPKTARISGIRIDAEMRAEGDMDVD